MYERDGIVYAGDPVPTPKLSGVRPLPDYMLWLRFNTGEARVFDCKPLLDFPVFAPFREISVFNSVYIDYGTAVWNDGNIYIAPETLYEQGQSVDCQ